MWDHMMIYTIIPLNFIKYINHEIISWIDRYFVRTGEQLSNFNVKSMVRDSKQVEVLNMNSISMLRGSILQVK